MSFEQKFDRIIKHKIEEAEFPFDEANWLKANKLLNGEKGASAGKGTKVFMLAAAIVLMLGTGAFFTYKYFNSDISVAVAEKNNSGKDQNSLNEVSSSKQDFNKTNEKVDGINSGANTSVAISENVNKVHTEGADEKHNSASSSTNENTLVDENNHAGVILKKDISSKSLNNSEAKSVSALALVNKKRAASNSKISADRTAKTLAKSGSQSVTGPAPGKVKAKGGYTDEQNSDVVVEERAYSYNENEYRLFTRELRLSYFDEDTFALAKTPYDFIRIYEDDYYKASRKRKTHFANVEGGMAYMMGWNVPVGKDAKGFNAYLGANYGLHLGKRVSASVGAQLYNIGNIEQPFYTGSNVTYGFGSNGTYTAVASNSLYYFAIPVKATIGVSKYDQFGFGVNAGLLFNGMNTVETYEMKDGIKSNVSKTRYSGYFDGTNTLNLMLSASYGRKISKRMRANAEFVYGISDTYRNNATSSSKENNMGIRLGLQYTLFDK